mmetsp:Transcript_12827/g.39156  ORF Transcript_12827/g.39156 Transcript_12827/m.39156 type:complete len:283 (-) Transcript_12827:2-850(-)
MGADNHLVHSRHHGKHSTVSDESGGNPSPRERRCCDVPLVGWCRFGHNHLELPLLGSGSQEGLDGRVLGVREDNFVGVDVLDGLVGNLSAGREEGMREKGEARGWRGDLTPTVSERARPCDTTDEASESSGNFGCWHAGVPSERYRGSSSATTTWVVIRRTEIKECRSSAGRRRDIAGAARPEDAGAGERREVMSAGACERHACGGSQRAVRSARYGTRWPEGTRSHVLVCGGNLVVELCDRGVDWLLEVFGALAREVGRLDSIEHLHQRRRVAAAPRPFPL